MQFGADIAPEYVAWLRSIVLDSQTGDAEQAIFRWSCQLTPSQFGDYVATLSHISTLLDAECQGTDAAAGRLASNACDADRTPTATVELDAVCSR